MKIINIRAESCNQNIDNANDNDYDCEYGYCLGVLMKIILIMALIAFSSSALSMSKPVCNKLGKKPSSILSIEPDVEYCFSNFASNRFVNLTNNIVMAASEFDKVYELRPYEESRIRGRIHILSYGDGAVISTRKTIILTPIKNDKKKAINMFLDNDKGGYLIRSSQKFLPSVMIPIIAAGIAAGGASIGDSIMDGEEICIPDVIVSAVAGAAAGAAIPIMTTGFIGTIAASGVGLSAKGMCSSCHLGSYCGRGKH